MPVESVEERGLLDMELAAATVQGRGDVESPSDAYTGRSSAYGYLARGLILQLVSYEWHNKASKQGGHPLVDVLESFRKEGLYSHWLRTFTRLDYFPAQLEQYASTIRRACNVNTPTTDLLSDVPVGAISLYLDGLICDANTLKWQLGAGGDVKNKLLPRMFARSSWFSGATCKRPICMRSSSRWQSGRCLWSCAAYKLETQRSRVTRQVNLLHQEGLNGKNP